MKQMVNFNDPQLVENDPENQLEPIDPNLPPFMEEPQQSTDQLEQQLQTEQQPPAMSDLQSRLARYQDLKNKISTDGFDQRNKDQGMALLLKASQQIGQGMANRQAPNYKADTSIADTLYKQADQNVSDIDSRQKLENSQIELANNADMNDSTSPISSSFQDALIRLKPDLNEQQINNIRKSSAEQLSKLFPQLNSAALANAKGQRLSGRPVTKDVERDGKVYVYKYNPETQMFEDTGLLKGYAPAIVKDTYTGENKMVSKGTQAQNILDKVATKVDPSGNKIEQTAYEKLEPKLREDFVKNHGADYEKETKDTQQKLSTLNSLNDLATTVRNSTPEDKKSNLNAFATAVASFYQKGVLSDKDVERYIKTPELKSRFMNAISTLGSGTLDDTTVDQIMNGVNIIAKEQQNFIDKQAEEKSKQFYNKNKSILDAKGVKALDFAPMLNPDYKSKELDPKIDAYAKAHNLNYDKALSILKARGYNGK